MKDRQEQSGLTNKPISSKVKKIHSAKEKALQKEMDRRHVAIGSVWAKAMLHVNPPQ